MYFTFTHPEYLWYIASIPVLVASHFAFLKYTRRKAIRFANFQALQRVAEQKIVTKNYLILILRLLIIVALVFAIAGTKLWYKGLTDKNDYVIAIDTSASMSSEDFKPTRLDVAKTYSRNFVRDIKSDTAVGIVSFAGAAFIEQLPSNDKGQVISAIDGMENSAVGGTNIPDAIVTSTNLLVSSPKGKSIILITDGSNTASYFSKDPIEEGIKYARENSVIIYTIGIGTNSGPIGYLPEYYNISSVFDPDTLLKIANETGGKFYNANNNIDIQNAYADISQDASVAFIGIDMTVGLMIIVLALIFLEWGLINTRYRSIP